MDGMSMASVCISSVRGEEGDDVVDSSGAEKAINNAITTLDDSFLCRAIEAEGASNLITAREVEDKDEPSEGETTDKRRRSR